MPRVKTFNENEVLQKAMFLFWKQGYAATSIQDLVEHLGVNRASLYSTFGDKDQLFKKALKLYQKINSEGVQAFLESQSNTQEGFRLLFQNAIEDVKTDQDRKGCFVVNTTTEIIPGDPVIQQSLQSNQELFVRVFQDFLQKGEAQGDFASGKDLASIALTLFMVYNGLRVVGKIQTDTEKLTQSVNQVLSILT